MPATFIVVPEWQGSNSARAMRLVDGAKAIAGDLPSSSTIIVDVPLEAGEALDSGVSRFSSLKLVRERQSDALATVHGLAVTIGGDCVVELAAVAHADMTDAALVWFDAHADLHTPESSPSGSYSGMIVRTLLGEGPDELLPAHPLSAEHLVFVGTRSIDDAEDELIRDSGVRVFGGETIDSNELVAAIEATGAASVYIHVDLDVLDPSQIDGVGYPEPFGLSAAGLIAAIDALRARFALVGAGITGFAPRSAERAADDLPTILRVIGALTR